jgi:hypothetical protein
MVDGKAANTKVSLKLTEKPGDCVVWIVVTPKLELQSYLWFGDPPGEPLPDIRDMKVARHTKGNADGMKAGKRYAIVDYLAEEDAAEIVARCNTLRQDDATAYSNCLRPPCPASSAPIRRDISTSSCVTAVLAATAAADRAFSTSSSSRFSSADTRFSTKRISSRTAASPCTSFATS